MTKWQLIAIGFFILVVVPTLLGLLVARFWGWAPGAFIGVLALASILSLYYRKLNKGVKAQGNDRRHNHNKNSNQGGEH